MNTAFFVVFGLFLVAMVGLAVTAVRWGIRRDRLARSERPHLSDTDLSDTDLSDTDLSDTDLSDTDLSDTDLSDTDLSDTDTRP